LILQRLPRAVGTVLEKSHLPLAMWIYGSTHDVRQHEERYQHCSEKQLHRCLAEFDFMYSNRVKLGVDDAERTDRAVRQIEGKGLTYRRTRGPRSEAGSETLPPF